MRSVRLEVRRPMRIRVSKEANGKETDSHIFEYTVGDAIGELQKEVTKIALRWKGGYFGIGTRFVIERLPDGE